MKIKNYIFRYKSSKIWILDTALTTYTTITVTTKSCFLYIIDVFRIPFSFSPFMFFKLFISACLRIFYCLFLMKVFDYFIITKGFYMIIIKNNFFNVRHLFVFIKTFYLKLFQHIKFCMVVFLSYQYTCYFFYYPNPRRWSFLWREHL